MLQKLAFCHIHKTAGTTVSSYLRSNYPADTVFPVDSVHAVNQKHINEINDYSLLTGHFPLSFLRAFLNNDWKIITVLRNPVERFISHIAFNHQLAHHANATVPAIDISQLESELEAYSNFQTKFLGAWLSRDEWRYLVASIGVATYPTHKLWNRGGAATALRIATEELQQVDWILDSSSLVAGLQRVAYDCGLWPFDDLPTVNRGTYRRGVRDAERTVLEVEAHARNGLDEQLMAFAKPLFAKALDDLELKSHHRAWMSRYDPSRVHTVAADHGFMGTGWTGPYYTPDGNGFFWSDTALDQFLYFPITIAGQYEFELSFFLPDRQDGFALAITLGGTVYAPVEMNSKGDSVQVVFRPDYQVADVGRLLRMQVHTDCSTQHREPGGIPNAGIVFNGALARLVTDGGGRRGGM